MANDFSSVVSTISSIFKISPSWLTFPAIITNVIVPFILMAYAFYKLLGKLKIFRGHATVDAVLAVIFAFVLLPVGPVAAIGAAGFIGMFGLDNWKSRILFILILAAFYFVALPYLSSIKF